MLFPIYGSAQGCPLNLQISFSDGEKGCLTDLPLSNFIEKKWNRPISSIVKNSNYYAIASSSICNIVTIGAHNGSAYNDAARGATDPVALGACPNKCECAVVVRNGKVLLPKKLAMLIDSDEAKFSEKSDKNTNLEKPKIIQALAELEEAKKKELEIAKQKEIEVQRQVEAQLKKEIELQAQKQKDLEIAKQREIEAQKLAEAQKIKDLQARQKAEAESKERERLLALAAEEEKRKAQEAERQRLKAEAEAKERERQLALAAEQEKQKALDAQKAIDKNLSLAKIEQSERQKDRELLMQLSAELAKLRAEADSLKKGQSLGGQSQIVSSSSKSEVIQVTAQVFANRKALVIGNDGYKFVSKLQNAKEDANAIAENLTKVGYKVTLKVDQSEKEMKAALRGFKAQVEAGDEVAFFFAGHGVQLANTNYLLPIDVAGEGEEQIKDEAISLQRILDDMSDKKVKFTLAMIDACRDNPFKGSGRSIGGGARGLAPTTAATGQMVVFSAGTGQQALDKLGPTDKDKNGLFTRIFIKEMQKSGITIDQLVRNVRNEVVITAKTIGHEQVPAIYDQVVGEFYFRK